MAGVRTTLLAVLLALLPAAAPAIADDGLALLNRIAQGSRVLTYSGTFVYRSGHRLDTSRFVLSLNNGV